MGLPKTPPPFPTGGVPPRQPRQKEAAEDFALPEIPPSPRAASSRPPVRRSPTEAPRRAPQPARAQSESSRPQQAPPQQKRVNPLTRIDFSKPLSSIRLETYGIDARKLPLFQPGKGRPTDKNYVRELRLVKDDGNSRGPIVVDVETGALFRRMNTSEFSGEDPLLQIEDFNADDLNAEAAMLLGHLQVTSSREKKGIALAAQQQKKAHARIAAEAERVQAEEDAKLAAELAELDK